MKNGKPGVIVIDGHVQGLALTRSLGEQGIPVIVVDRFNCITRYSKYCKKYFKSPEYLTESFIDFLMDLGNKENLKDWTLLPCDDHIVYNISKNKERLSSVYKIISPDFNDLRKIINKRTLLDLATEVDVPVPDSVYPDKQDITKLGCPCIIKGNEGQTFYKKTGQKAFWLNKYSEFDELTGKYKISEQEIFVQEYIPFDGNNHTVSFTAFSINGEIKTFWMGEKLRDHPVRFGTATFCRSIMVDDVVEYGKRLIKELNYTGVSEIEFIKDPNDGKFKLIEINPRTWLWVGFAKKTGVNFPVYIYNHLNGIKTEYPSGYKTGYYWINLWTDTIFSIKYILQGRLKLKTYISSLFKRKVCAVFSFNDPLPFLMMGILLPYLARKR
jgi:predicted ATP-grasp superfamily ATP-dependent carboligase